MAAEAVGVVEAAVGAVEVAGAVGVVAEAEAAGSV